MSGSSSSKLPLAVLISGRGSNLEALAKACCEADYPTYIKRVVSNNVDALGLNIAAEYRLGVKVIAEDGDDFEAELLAAVADCRLVCLAGFMKILGAEFIAAAPPIINIHPSLLPKYKGLDTHKRAIADGERLGGCTVHRVIAEVDGGEILGQTELPITAADDEQSLAARVLQAEHRLYPLVVKRLAERLVGRTAGR